MRLPRILVNGEFYPCDILITTSDSHRITNSSIEHQIDSIWEKTLAEAYKNNQICYNGVLYRLNALNQSGNKIILNLSTIEYKVRYGLAAISKKQNLEEEYYSRSCSCTSTVITADEKYVMVELSGKSMNPNKTELIGGLMENDLNMYTGDDIFQAFYKELREEVGVSVSDIKKSSLQAVFIEDSTNICFYFQTTLNITADELLSRFSTNNDSDIKSILIFDKKLYLESLKNHPNINKRLIGQIA